MQIQKQQPVGISDFEAKSLLLPLDAGQLIRSLNRRIRITHTVPHITVPNTVCKTNNNNQW